MIEPSLAESLRLIVITDVALAAPRRVVEVVGLALRGGAGAVQLRHKDAPARDLVALGTELRRRTRSARALLFVNDRFDVALAIGADGVHLGPHDLPVRHVRRVAPEGFLIGRSADAPDVARRAAADGADYIGCGTVYPTATKQDAGGVIGLKRLDEVARAAGIPTVGIGGVTVARAHEVAHTHACGVAVVGAVMAAEDPQEAARELLNPFLARPCQAEHGDGFVT